MAIDQILQEAAGADKMSSHSKYRRPELLYRASLCVATRDVRPAAQLRHATYVSYFTSSQVIEATLAKDCAQGTTAHECMTAFKADPHVVKNWRILWTSMPKNTRYELVLQMMRACPDEYTFMGYKLCRAAFMLLTGLGAGKLTELRSLAARGAVTVTNKTQLQLGGIGRNAKAPRYLDARAWIQIYAEQHGEMSPMSGVTLLPAGRKSFYHLAYVNDRENQDLTHLDGKCADLGTFLKAWRQ